MAKPKRAGGTGKTTVQTKTITACPIGNRCHVNGPDLTMFGKSFTKARVSKLAATSVLLTDTSQNKVAGSGTLVTWAPPRGVVLCSVHEMNFSTPTDLSVWLLCEATAATAAKGVSKGQADWDTGTPVEPAPHGKVTKVIESGATIPGDLLDYAFLEFTVTTPPANGTPLAAKPATSVTTELLLIAHPLGQKTQGSAGTLVTSKGPTNDTLTGDSYIWADGFDATYGSSGGGVFNSNDQIVGVYRGTDKTGRHVALNLGTVASSAPAGSSVLQKWMNGGGTP